MQQLATGDSCNGEMGQHLIYVSINVLRCMDALRSKAVKWEGKVRNSFRCSFVPLGQRLQSLFAQEATAGFKSDDDL